MMAFFIYNNNENKFLEIILWQQKSRNLNAACVHGKYHPFLLMLSVRITLFVRLIYNHKLIYASFYKNIFSDRYKSDIFLEH